MTDTVSCRCRHPHHLQHLQPIELEPIADVSPYSAALYGTRARAPRSQQWLLWRQAVASMVSQLGGLVSRRTGGPVRGNATRRATTSDGRMI